MHVYIYESLNLDLVLRLFYIIGLEIVYIWVWCVYIIMIQ